MRDYLNLQERKDLLLLKKIIDMDEKILENWKKNNNIAKDEVTNLKKSMTWGLKAYESILNRQNKKSLESYINSLKQCKVTLEDTFAVNIYNRKMSSKLDDDIERNKDYFRLIELIMHYNCRSCTKCHMDCEFYNEFEEHCIPEPTGENNENCRYAYKG